MPRKKTATSPENREKQLILLATDLAEQQLRNGTASAQVITHYLKLGSTKERVEREILERQAELITAKTETLKANKRMDEIYTDAIQAMKRYSGHQDED